jgi:hypothetical protein
LPEARNGAICDRQIAMEIKKPTCVGFFIDEKKRLTSSSSRQLVQRLELQLEQMRQERQQPEPEQQQELQQPFGCRRQESAGQQQERYVSF